MAAWWIYGENGLGERWYHSVPNGKFTAYAAVRRLTQTSHSFDMGRMVGPGAYEFRTAETQQRGERWFIFTQGGARHLVESRELVDHLLQKSIHLIPSPLKAELRAS